MKLEDKLFLVDFKADTESSGNAYQNDAAGKPQLKKNGYRRVT